MYQLYKTYEECLIYLYSFVQRGYTRHQDKPYRLDLEKAILNKLDNPQDKIKIIHIAGTSGKGSTATYISELLANRGLIIGLTVSPHLVDIREILQINNKLISKSKFIKYINNLVPTVEEYIKIHNECPTYYEFLIILFYYICVQEKVDYAVVETGLGGLIDGTNVSIREDKISVITRIGLDHTKLLGNTYSKIAFQKAGIINKNSVVFTIEQRKDALDIIKHEAEDKKTTLNIIAVKEVVSNVVNDGTKQTCDVKLPGLNINKLVLNSVAYYQIENVILALSVYIFIAKRDNLALGFKHIRHALISKQFEGRMSVRRFTINGKDKLLIADGAHNPQKMAVFLGSLKKLKIKSRIAFVIGFKDDKDTARMFKMIKRYASRIYLTSFIIPKIYAICTSKDLDLLKQELLRLNFNNIKTCANVNDAFQEALSEYDTVVITGSLYLLSDAYLNTKYFIKTA